MCSFRNINCSHSKITYPNFKEMYLNNNMITELHEDIFISLPNIVRISLNDNLIKSISYNLFINNNILEEINLYNNSIKIFIVELAHILTLRSLELSGNPIETFHEGTLKNFFIQHTQIDKYMGIDLINNFTCDCNVNWIQRIKKEIAIQYFYLYNKTTNLDEFFILYTNLENICINNINTNLIG